MGLVENKAKLYELETQLSNKEGSLKLKIEECNKCKISGCSISQQVQCNPQNLQRFSSEIAKIKRDIDALKITIAAEEIKNDVYLKEQEILNQTFGVDKSEQEVAQAKAKALQELEKLKVEAARASAAMRLADNGDNESARALLGVMEAEGSWKKPVIISGIIILALGVGFGIYKMIK